MVNKVLSAVISSRFTATSGSSATVLDACVNHLLIKVFKVMRENTFHLKFHSLKGNKNMLWCPDSTMGDFANIHIPSTHSDSNYDSELEDDDIPQIVWVNPQAVTSMNITGHDDEPPSDGEGTCLAGGRDTSPIPSSTNDLDAHSLGMRNHKTTN
ncbi:hypothetical protein A0H81_07891 [Grifola frondosa]|uniref:Uncharacterized protein n=1 Tax=Grifola frondosa TaxID=5627 RepID=A0A1C7MC93_GRIFR|nr:hypothetical protein A0H81_07891 [Grifola frondosa]